MSLRTVLFGLAIAAAAGGLSSAVAQPASSGSTRAGVYTADQAARGKALYTEKCASCHGSMASATPDMAPLLNDHVFQATWKALSIGDFFERIRNTMPQNQEGTLSPAQTADIVAYILSANRAPAGDVALPDNVDALKRIAMDLGQP
jgi:mono/diheme cytochrome c family protein